jgi:hypothetical protein
LFARRREKSEKIVSPLRGWASIRGVSGIQIVTSVEIKGGRRRAQPLRLQHQQQIGEANSWGRYAAQFREAYRKINWERAAGRKS